jgi:hypothetical protein
MLKIVQWAVVMLHAKTAAAHRLGCCISCYHTAAHILQLFLLLYLIAWQAT